MLAAIHGYGADTVAIAGTERLGVQGIRVIEIRQVVAEFDRANIDDCCGGNGCFQR